MDDLTKTFDLIFLIIAGCIIGFGGLYILIKNIGKAPKIDPDYLTKGKKEEAKGMIFGKLGTDCVYSPEEKEGHCVVFGGSGLGKTSAVLIPTLRSWTGSSFTVDISGDISRNVDIPNKLEYEPGTTGSIPYNIFHQIDQIDDIDDINEELEKLTYLLLPDDPKANSNAQYFITEGRKILTASFIAFYGLGYDFIEICEKIMNKSYKDLFNSIDRTKNTKAMQYINSFEGANEQNIAGCKQSADLAVKIFATNEKIKKSIRRNREDEEFFSPEKIEDHNVFLIVPDHKLDVYSQLLHIITSQCLDFFSRRAEEKTNQILFCLDEFASLGKLEITSALRKFRKRHIRIIILTQSLADIDGIYSKDERVSMFDNFTFKCILGAYDVTTQELFSKLIGYKKINKKSVSSGAKGVTKTVSEDKEFVVEPSKFSNLKNDLILIYPGGNVKLQKNFYFR